MLTLLLRRKRSYPFPSLLGFQEFRVSNDLPVVLKFGQLGPVQILTEPPELRIDIIEVNDADRRLLATDDAQASGTVLTVTGSSRGRPSPSARRCGPSFGASGRTRVQR